MNLWLYSSGDGEENEAMDEDLIYELSVSRPVFTFIPAHSEDADLYYDEFIDRFSVYDYINFRMVDLEHGLSPREVNELLRSDMIYLSGGNTFHFLKYLRQSGIINDLRYYARSGGFLAGHSAGAILTTPQIRTAAIPEFDRDENDAGIKSILSMRLTKFEFFPHYQDNDDYSEALIEASLKGHFPIYGVADGAGVSVSPKGVRFYGNVWVFFQGLKLKLAK